MEEIASAAPPPRLPRVLLCASGSVATIKIPALTAYLAREAEVRIVVTKQADYFLARAKAYDAAAWEKFVQLTSTRVSIVRDDDEWAEWTRVGDPVVHIDLKDWADVMVVAPLSANTLAKLAHGFSDNLLTSVARAWPRSKPFVIAPAMNTDMWNHPFTAQQLKMLENIGCVVIPPVEKRLACGVVGNGGMASVETIVDIVQCLYRSSASSLSSPPGSA